MNTPKELGFYFPAEFEEQRAMWLSWPHKEASWPGKIMSIYPKYAEFIRIVALSEKVCINVHGPEMKDFASEFLSNASVDFSNVDFFYFETNDAWCRDHGPAFLSIKKLEKKLLLIGGIMHGVENILLLIWMM